MIWTDLNLVTPQTVVDIGVNTGIISNEISGYYPEARILAVESSPDLHCLLRQYAKAVAIEIAIGLSKGVSLLDYYRVNGGEDAPLCSLTQSDTFAEHHGLQPSRQREVCTITLADFANDDNLNLVDILKIDVEDLELDVLRGFPLLESHHIKSIAIKWPTRLANNGPCSALYALLDALKQYDYLPVGSSIDWRNSNLVDINNKIIFLCSFILGKFDG